MISIIIPTHNRAGLISRSINSIIKQTYNDWELIIVNDGSSDNTKEQITPFLADERIKYIELEMGGAAQARNVGAEEARGKYITFLDSDDEAKSEWLEEIIKATDKYNPGLVCCGIEVYNSEEKKVNTKLPESEKQIFGDLVYKMTNAGAFIVERELFFEVGGYDKNLQSGQHSELSFRLLPHIEKSGKIIFNIYKPLIKVHHHKGERIRKDPERKFQGSTYCLRKHSIFFKQRNQLRANYLGTAGRNAFLTKRKSISMKLFLKAFIAKPSLKRFGRLVLYGYRNTFS